MVSERKRQQVKALQEDLGKFQVIGLLDMHKMPARQLQEMRDKLRGKATIKMIRKSLIRLAIEGVDKKNLRTLEDKIQNQPALLLSDMDPFELSRIINSAKSPAPAKPGDVAPREILIKAGPTNLKAGPVIGELQRAKIPAGVEGENIVIKKDAVVAKAGEEIGKNVADILMKLGIEPMEIGLNLVCIWDKGLIFGRDILFVPPEKYVEDIQKAYNSGFNLALNMGLITKFTLPALLAKAYREASSLAEKGGILTKENTASMLAKGKKHMETLKGKVEGKGNAGKDAGEKKDHDNGGV